VSALDELSAAVRDWGRNIQRAVAYEGRNPDAERVALQALVSHDEFWEELREQKEKKRVR